jgi:hypothetical protein
MRNANFKVLAAIVLAVFMISGCGLSKMVKKYNTVKFKATPEVLETHGGKISVTVEGTIPAKYFHKKATVAFTPVLKYATGETKLKTITLKGEKAAGDGQSVAYKSGTSFTYTDVFDYNPAMNASELKVNPVASLKKKSVNLGEVKLADGVIYTSERVGQDLEDMQIAPHNYELETIITEAGNLYFEYNKSNLNANLALNKDQASKDRIVAVENFLKKNWQIKSLDILAWASPEGELSLNQKLADERGKVGNTYMIDKLKKMIKDKAINLVKPEDAKLNVVSKGEDYDGFMKALNASNLAQKQTIANVINSQDTKPQREKAIKDMTVIYAEVEQMLSVLRRDEIKVYCYEPKKTKDNIIQLSTTAPDKLDNKELLYSATLTDDWNTKYQIYKSATQIYPQDWRNFCNAGVAAMAVGKLDEAASYLDKANTLKANDPQVAFNLGVLAVWNKNYETAATYFATAKKGNIDCSYPEGVIKIRKGDYNGALSSFGSKKCRYNIALAQILNGGAAEGLKTLDCTKPQTAAVYYLTAVAGARSGNTTIMYDNIKKAISADSKYRDQAKEDREFLKYFKESAFQDAVK